MNELPNTLKSTVASKAVSSSTPFSGELDGKLWPNGECVIWKVRKYRPQPPVVTTISEDGIERLRLFRMMCADRTLRAYAPLLLGLSFLSIFDKLKGDVVKPSRGKDCKVRVRKGTSGITSYGRRIIRNAAHLIESESGNGRAIFATVTVPDLPLEQMRVLHEKWNDVVERYRLYVARALKDDGLSGEIVTVSEIQTKRHERTGLPILHLHSVFCGVNRFGKFSLTCEQHDAIWASALNVAVFVDSGDCTKACNLQRVKKSASGYMAKYLSKGSEGVSRAVEDGFDRWLPKHWWNCTRTLARRVKQQCRGLKEFAQWLAEGVNSEGHQIWIWHRVFALKRDDGSTTNMAVYGQLDIGQTAQIQEYYPLGQTA